MTEPNKAEHSGCTADMVVGEDGRITVDAVTQARLEALLEAAGEIFLHTIAACLLLVQSTVPTKFTNRPLKRYQVHSDLIFSIYWPLLHYQV